MRVSRCALNDEFITCPSLSLLLRHHEYRRLEREREKEEKKREEFMTRYTLVARRARNDLDQLNQHR